MLFGGYFQHLWILDKTGHPVVNDFIVFWVAAHLAMKGAVLAAYDAHREHAAELAAIGHTYRQVLGWSYPPLFLLIVILPAQLPYVPAFLLWCGATLGLYALTIAAIAKRAVAFMVACAMPWALVEFILGQNGFLTAAVIGTALLQLEKRPFVSRIVAGLPQLQAAIRHSLPAGAGGRRLLARLRLGCTRHAAVERACRRYFRFRVLRGVSACAVECRGHASRAQRSRLEQASEHLWLCARSGRAGRGRLGDAGAGQRGRGARRRRLLEKPQHAVRAEGRAASHRDPARHALRSLLRRAGTRSCGRVSLPPARLRPVRACR